MRNENVKETATSTSEITDTKERNGKSSSRRSKNNSKSTSRNRNTGSSSSNSSWTSQLAYDVTQFPFAGALGNKLQVLDSGSVVSGESWDIPDYVIPGIMAFGVHPSIGWSDQPNSPINLAAQNIYAFVTHANSRNASYEAPDLMTYFLGVTELYKMWQYGARLYGVMRNYSALNKYTPEVLIKAMGFNPAGIDICKLRGQLNLLSSKISSLVLPAVLPGLTSEMNLFSQVYVDSENSRAQMYVFYPSHYWLYTDAYASTGAGLVQTETPAATYQLWNYEEYLTALNQMADNILASKFMGVMAADIIKAFGDKIYTCPTIPEEYVVYPTYADDFLETINNLCVLPTPGIRTVDWDNYATISSGSVFQVIPSAVDQAPYLRFTPGVNSEQGPINAKLVDLIHTKIRLNTQYETLTPAQVIDRTMFAGYCDTVINSGATKQDYLIKSRMNIITAIMIWTGTGTAVGKSIITNSLAVDPTTPLSNILPFSQFKNAPMMSYYTGDGSAEDKYTFNCIYGNIENLALISHGDFDNLNDAVLQLLMAIPV